MTTPSEIAALVARTAPNGDIEERPGHLVLRAPLDEDSLRAAWLALAAAPPAYVTGVAITDADMDAPLAAGDVPAAGQRFRIVVASAQVQGELRLYRAASLAVHAAALGGGEHVLVADMGADETFTTYRSRFELWTEDPPLPFAASEPLPDPRRFTGDFTGRGEAPADIRPWLLRAAPTRAGPAYLAWSGLAARRLLAALADRVALDDEGRVAYHFSGPPACVVTITDAEALALLPRLQAGAAWVYPEGRDPDTRHLLLAAEWARTHRRGSPAELGENSLESAKAAYGAYVKAGSRETLKAIADLRKAVVEETQKVAQRAQDLAGALWRDVAVTAAPFVLKILPDAGKAPSRELTVWMAVAAAVYVAFSFGIQVFINKRSFRRQKEARWVWKSALNVVLTASEVEEYSEVPIRNSLQDYRRVRFVVGLVYAGLIAILMWFAWTNAQPVQPLSAPPAAVIGPTAPTPLTGEQPAAAVRATTSAAPGAAATARQDAGATKPGAARTASSHP